MSQLSLSFLGTFDVRYNRQPITDFRSAKVRALLAYLVLEADRPHQRAHLAGLFWPEWAETAARTYVRQAINNLQQIGKDQPDVRQWLRTTHTTVQFNTETNCWIDVELLATKVEPYLRFHPHTLDVAAIDLLQQAVALYRGPLLAGFFLDGCPAFEEWLLLKRERFHQHALATVQLLASYYEAQGKYEQAQQYAWRGVELEPTLEEAHRQLMRLLMLTGQRSAALHQFEQCRQILAKELGVEPGAETVAFYEQIRTGDAAAFPKGSQAAHNPATRGFAERLSAPLLNLPTHITRLVGRATELAAIALWLADPDCRLLTLLGPGGIGKTRLAIGAAMAQLPHFTHGVHFVPLAPVSAVHTIPVAIAEALQLSYYGAADIKGQLLNYLHTKKLLLVLDNFEHLLEGIAFVQELLAKAPLIKVIVTSRERLRIQEEWLFSVEGLQIPEDNLVLQGKATSTPDELVQYGSIQLFLNCARRLRPDFSLTTTNPSDVIMLCRTVGGIPLAIELATGWLRVMSCLQIAQEIQNNLDFLHTALHNVPQRHRSLRAVFEHSWHLLSAEEQRALPVLAIFRGGFRRDAAATIAQASVQMLLTFIDKTLIQLDAGGRYQMHELLRQFLLTKLAETPAEQIAAHHQHCDYYLTFLLEQIDFDQKPTTKQALDEISPEFDNIYAAWRWAIDQKRIKTIERVKFSFWQYAELRGRHPEFYELMMAATTMLRAVRKEEAVIAHVDDFMSAAHSLIRVLISLGLMTIRFGDSEQMEQYATEALSILREIKAEGILETAWAVVLLGWARYKQGKYEDAYTQGEQALALFHEHHTWWGKGQAYLLLGSIRYATGDYTKAEFLFGQHLAAWRTAQIYGSDGFGLRALAHVAQAQGDYAKAEELAKACYQIQQELNDLVGTAYTLSSLGHIMRAQRKFEQAQDYYQHGLELAEKAGLRTIGEACQYGLGWVHYESGEYPQARLYLEATLKQFEQYKGTPPNTAATINALAMVACTQGQYDEAHQHLRRALHIAQTGGSVPLTLDILLSWAQLLWRQGQVKEARRLLLAVRDHPATKHAVREKATQLLVKPEFERPNPGSFTVQQEPTITIDEFVEMLLAQESPV